MDLPFQMDLDVHPGISLVPPRLRLLTQEPFPSDPKFYSIVVLFEKGCSSPFYSAIMCHLMPNTSHEIPIYKIAKQHCTANIVL